MSIGINPNAEFKKWSFSDIKKWLGTESFNLNKLGEGFVSLDMWLTESQNESEREQAFRLTHQLLDRLDDILTHQRGAQGLSQNNLAQIFGVLATLLAEAGPYRFETNKADADKIAETILLPMRNIRKKAVEVAKDYFSLTEFSPLGEAIEQEIYPILKSMLDEGRYMPFRVIQAAKLAERLHELKIRVEEIEDKKAEELLSLIDEIYDLKYPRFGTSGLRGLWQIDFTNRKVQHTVQAICDYMSDHEIPTYVRPNAQDLSGKWVIIGYDSRRNAQHVARWAAQICLHNGFKVCFASRATPTPVSVFYALKVLGEDNIAGIINCTASHNPPEWQGLKFNPRAGFPAPTHLTDIIAARTNHKQLLDAPLLSVESLDKEFEKAAEAGEFVEFDPIVHYWDWIKVAGNEDQRLPMDFQAISEYFRDKLIVVDEMHGAGRGYMGRILGELGIPHQVIHAETDPGLGDLEYANPEPPYIQPLVDAVREQGAALGLGLDTDADRFGIVDEGGTYFRPNQILAMLTRYLGVDRKLTGRVVITQTGLPMIDNIAAHIPNNDEHKPKSNVIPLYVDHAFYVGSIGQPELTMHSLYKNVFVVPVGIKYIAEIPRFYNDYSPIPEEELGPDWMDTMLIGGEESSGLTTRGHVPDKDGPWADLLIMDMIAYYKKPLVEIWRDVINMEGCWETFGGRTDIDASDEAKEKVISYYLDDFSGAKPGDVEIGGYKVNYLGGVRFDLAEIFLNEDEAGVDHFLRVRASGTEPINRIYYESSDEDGALRLRDAALEKLDDCSMEVIRSAYSPWRLVDILASTEPSPRLQDAVEQAIATKDWDKGDLAHKLQKKRKTVEKRNVHVVNKWLKWLGVD